MKTNGSNMIDVERFGFSIIDYYAISGTLSIVERIEETPQGVLIFIKNGTTPYFVEEVFHPQSLALLIDKLMDGDKYTRIIENFYNTSEKLVVNFFRKHELSHITITDKDIEFLGFFDTERGYGVIDGVVIELSVYKDKVFFTIMSKYFEHPLTTHISECSASDIVVVLHNILYK